MFLDGSTRRLVSSPRSRPVPPIGSPPAGKKLAFSPEFMGESPSHRWPEIYSAGFAIFGGDPAACGAARRAYELSSPVALEYVETSAALAELSKYTLNGFLAAKVSFMNQIYDIATEAGLDYEELRKLVLLDPRVGESHTLVTRERGFGGKCFPKDLNASISWASQRSDPRLLQAVADYNDAIRRPGARRLQPARESRCASCRRSKRSPNGPARRCAARAKARPR